jgi:hypothetical protein
MPRFASPLNELVYPPGLRDYFAGECQRLVSALGPGTGLVEKVRRSRAEGRVALAASLLARPATAR